MSKVSTRKIISGCVILLVGIGVAVLKGDIPPNLNSLMQTLYGAFVLGNAFEHFTNSKNQVKEEGKE